MRKSRRYPNTIDEVIEILVRCRNMGTAPMVTRVDLKVECQEGFTFYSNKVEVGSWGAAEQEAGE